MGEFNIMSVREMIDRTFGDPKENTVDFNLLKAIMYILASQLRILQRHVAVEETRRRKALGLTMSVTELKIHTKRKKGKKGSDYQDYFDDPKQKSLKGQKPLDDRDLKSQAKGGKTSTGKPQDQKKMDYLDKDQKYKTTKASSGRKTTSDMDEDEESKNTKKILGAKTLAVKSPTAKSIPDKSTPTDTNLASKPTNDKASTYKSATDKSTTDKSTKDKSTADKSTLDKSELSSRDKSTADKYATEKATADKYATDKSTGKSADKKITSKSAADGQTSFDDLTNDQESKTPKKSPGDKTSTGKTTTSKFGTEDERRFDDIYEDEESKSIGKSVGLTSSRKSPTSKFATGDKERLNDQNKDQESKTISKSPGGTTLPGKSPTSKFATEGKERLNYQNKDQESKTTSKSPGGLISSGKSPTSKFATEDEERLNDQNKDQESKTTSKPPGGKTTSGKSPTSKFTTEDEEYLDGLNKDRETETIDNSPTGKTSSGKSPAAKSTPDKSTTAGTTSTDRSSSTKSTTEKSSTYKTTSDNSATNDQSSTMKSTTEKTSSKSTREKSSTSKSTTDKTSTSKSTTDKTSTSKSTTEKTKSTSDKYSTPESTTDKPTDKSTEKSSTQKSSSSKSSKRKSSDDAVTSKSKKKTSEKSSSGSGSTGKKGGGGVAKGKKNKKSTKPSYVDDDDEDEDDDDSTMEILHEKLLLASDGTLPTQEQYRELAKQIRKLQVIFGQSDKFGLLDSLHKTTSMTDPMAAINMATRLDVAEKQLAEMMTTVTKAAGQISGIDLEAFDDTILKEAALMDWDAPGLSSQHPQDGQNFTAFKQPPKRRGKKVEKGESGFAFEDDSEQESESEIVPFVRIPSDSNINYADRIEFRRITRNIRETMIKQADDTLKQSVLISDDTYKKFKALDQQIDAAMDMGDAFSLLECDVDDYAEKINSLDGYISTQLTLYQDTLTQMQFDLESGLDGLAEALARPNEDSNAVYAELIVHFNSFTLDLGHMMHRQQELKNQHSSYAVDLEVYLVKEIYEALLKKIEGLRKQKCTRDELNDALSDKVDIAELNGIVAMNQFDAVNGDFQKQIRNAYEQFNNKEFVWQRGIEDLIRSLNEKADINGLLSLQNEIHKYLEVMKYDLDEMLAIVEDVRPNPNKKKIDRDGKCVSCGTNVNIEVNANIMEWYISQTTLVAPKTIDSTKAKKEDSSLCIPGRPIKHPIDPRSLICHKFCGAESSDPCKLESFLIAEWKSSQPKTEVADRKVQRPEYLKPCKPCNSPKYSP